MTKPSGSPLFDWMFFWRIGAHELGVKVHVGARFTVYHDGKLMGKGRSFLTKGSVPFEAREGRSTVEYRVEVRRGFYGALHFRIFRNGEEIVGHRRIALGQSN